MFFMPLGNGDLERECRMTKSDGWSDDGVGFLLVGNKDLEAAASEHALAYGDHLAANRRILDR